MSSHLAPSLPLDSAESHLRLALARGDMVGGSTVSVLNYVLRNDDRAMFADDVLAVTRGMLADLAHQIYHAAATGLNNQHPSPVDEQLNLLIQMLTSQSTLLRYIHALALEWNLIQRLQGEIGIDPVLTPLLQSLIASQDGAIGASAMKFLAAQARFVQNLRHMRYPITELPADVLHTVLIAVRSELDQDSESKIRSQYDESVTRLGLMSQLVASMGVGRIAARSITHSGASLFATAMAMEPKFVMSGAGLARDDGLLMMAQKHNPRFALMLRVMDYKSAHIAENCHILGHDDSVIQMVQSLRVNSAKNLLETSVAPQPNPFLAMD